VSQKYLLPCRCGQNVVLEPRQAGETVVCSCGATLTAPTMLKITALEPAPDETDDAAGGTSWGWQQRLVMIGSLAGSVGAVAALVLLLFGRPIAAADVMDPARLLLVTQTFQPAQTWFYWNQAKQGLDRRADQQYAAALTQFHIWETVACLILLAGVAAVVAGIVIGRTNRLPSSDAETTSN
jgi:hypothetical protein